MSFNRRDIVKMHFGLKSNEDLLSLTPDLSQGLVKIELYYVKN
jgi:hypothetical protein